jgi:hypothetical protein
MKKFSILHAASLGTAFALVFGAVYFTSVPQADAMVVALAEGGGGGGSSYTGGNTHCQYKKSCSGTTPYYVSGNNGCRGPQSESECQSVYGSSYHWISSSCQTCGSKVWYNGACRQTCHYSSNCSSGTCHSY